MVIKNNKPDLIMESYTLIANELSKQIVGQLELIQNIFYSSFSSLIASSAACAAARRAIGTLNGEQDT